MAQVPTPRPAPHEHGRHPDARTSAAIDAWLCDMDKPTPPSLAALFHAHFDALPPVLLRAVGECLSPRERARHVGVRERRRCFAVSHLGELCAAAHAAEEEDDDGRPRHADAPRAAAAATPSGTPHPTLFSQTGPAARLHGVYLQAIDSAATHAAQSAPSDAPLEDRFVAGEVR